MTSVLQQLTEERRRLGISPEQVSTAVGILVLDVGRMDRAESRVRLDHVVGYAAVLGLKLVLVQAAQPVAKERRQPLGADAVPGLLDGLRACFEACRSALSRSGSEVARDCGITSKAIFALERGPQIPWLGSAVAHAARFGLEIGLAPASLPIDKIAIAAASRFTPLDEQRGASSGYYIKTPRSEDEAGIVETLSKAFGTSGFSARSLASTIGVNWKTIAPGGKPSFSGRFNTTAGVARALGYRLLAVPASFELPASKENEAAPIEDGMHPAEMADAIASRFAQVRRDQGRTATQVAQDGFTVRTVSRLERDASSATLATLCLQARALGLRIVAVPERTADAVAGAAWGAGRSAARPVRTRAAPAGIDPAMEEYKRRVMATLFEDLDLVSSRPSASEVAGELHLNIATAEMLLAGRRHRVRMSELVNLLNLREARLAIGGEASGFAAVFGGGAAFEESLEAFVDVGIVHRHAKGLSTGAAGRIAGVSDKRIEAVEKIDGRILASSVLIYADALGEPWRLVGPMGTAPLRHGAEMRAETGGPGSGRTSRLQKGR